MMAAVAHGGASATPLSRLAREYTARRLQRRDVTQGTAKKEMRMIARLCRSYGQRPVRNLSERDIERWIATRSTITMNTLRLEIGTVRRFIDWLQREKHLRHNPMVNIRSPRVPRSTPRAIPRPDTDALWKVLPDSRARLMVALMLGLGLRRVEVSRLQVADWDNHSRTVRVVGKGGHQRILPVPDSVERALLSYLAEVGGRSGPLVRSQQNPNLGIGPERIGFLMAGWMADAGIKQGAWDGRGCHSLRHTLASEVADIEPDLRVVQQILGHRDLSSTQIYLRGAGLERLRSAMEQADTPVTADVSQIGTPAVPEPTGSV